MTIPTLDANNLVWAFQNGDQVQDYELQTTINNVLQTALTGYFNKTPCVCSGVIFTQTGTTNTFNFTGGVIRWYDQILGFNQTGTPVNFTQPAFAKIVAGEQTIIYSNSGDQQYIVAKLNVAVDVAHSNPDNTNTQYAQLTGSILPETKNLTEIQADQTLVPLQTMNLNTGIYSIGVDDNCIYRYGIILEPQVSPPVEINTNTTLTQTLNNVIATGNADLQVNMPLIASLTQPYPEFTITNQLAPNGAKLTINGNSTPIATITYASTTMDIYYGSTITLELVKGMSPFPNGYWRIKDSFINMPTTQASIVTINSEDILVSHILLADNSRLYTLSGSAALLATGFSAWSLTIPFSTLGIVGSSGSGNYGCVAIQASAGLNISVVNASIRCSSNNVLIGMVITGAIPSLVVAFSFTFIAYP